MGFLPVILMGAYRCNARKDANGDRQMQKAKQENTRFVASCSTKKYPFSQF